MPLLKSPIYRLSQLKGKMTKLPIKNEIESIKYVELIAQASEVIGEARQQIVNFCEDQNSKMDKLTTDLSQKQTELDLVLKRYSKLKNFLTQLDKISIPSLQEKSPTQHPSLSNKANQIQASLQGARLNEEIKLRISVLGKIKIRVEEIADHSELGLIGGKETRIAFKDPNSYLIASSKQGMKLVEENKALFLDNLPDPQWMRLINQIIYVESLNCYFLQMPTELYSKNIDKKQPIPYMRLDDRYSEIQYSKENGRLICLKNSTLSVINLRTKEVEFKIESKYYSTHRLRLFGKYRVVTAGTTGRGAKGFISLCKLNCQISYGIFFRNSEFELTGGDLEDYESYEDLQVCDKNRYCFLSLKGSIDESEFLSRIVILDAFGDRLTLKVNVHLLNQRITPNLCLKSAGYVKDLILWLGISRDRKVQLFCYDIEKEEVKELEERRVDSGDLAYQIERFGDDFYYTGDGAKIMRITIDK